MNEHRDANQTPSLPVRTTVIGQSPSPSDGRWVSGWGAADVYDLLFCARCPAPGVPG